MKKQLILLSIIIFISVTGCKKKQTEVEPDATENPMPGDPHNPFPPDPPEFDSEGITPAEAEKTYLTVFHRTKFETIPELDSSLVGWTMLVEDGHKIEATWDVPQSVNYSEKHSTVWDQILQKWRHKYYIQLNTKTALEQIEIKLNIKNTTLNKSFTRTQKVGIQVEDKFYDIHRLNFGMSKSEAKEAEFSRSKGTGSNWTEISPSIVRYGESYYLPAARARQYEFVEGKLSKISEFRFPYDSNDIHSPIPETWNEMIKHLGGVQLPEYNLDKNTGRYSLPKDFTWTTQGVKFTLGKRKFKRNETEVETLALVIEKE